MNADRFAEWYVPVGVCQEPCLGVTTEDLNLVAVATAAPQELAVGRDVELAGMGARGLVADASEKPRLAIDGKDGDAVSLQTIARIKEFAVGTQMDIRTTSCPNDI